jgi:hypothetical protein
MVEIAEQQSTIVTTQTVLDTFTVYCKERITLTLNNLSRWSTKLKSEAFVIPDPSTLARMELLVPLTVATHSTFPEGINLYYVTHIGELEISLLPIQFQRKTIITLGQKGCVPRFSLMELDMLAFPIRELYREVILSAVVAQFGLSSLRGEVVPTRSDFNIDLDETTLAFFDDMFEQSLIYTRNEGNWLLWNPLNAFNHKRSDKLGLRIVTSAIDVLADKSLCLRYCGWIAEDPGRVGSDNNRGVWIECALVAHEMYGVLIFEKKKDQTVLFSLPGITGAPLVTGGDLIPIGRHFTALLADHFFKYSY